MRSFPIIFLMGMLYHQVMAQSDQVVQLLDAVNSKIGIIQRGYYETAFRVKLPMKDDTLKGSGRVYFFRDTCGIDSICQFVLMVDQMPSIAYDGNFYYQFDHKNKKIAIKSVAISGVKAHLKSNSERFLFSRYLRCHKPAIEVEKLVNKDLKAVSLSFYQDKGHEKAKLSILDSFPNEYQLSQADPAIATISVEYHIALPSYTVEQRLEVIKMFENPQYKEIKLSPVFHLPDSATFQSILDIDKYEGLGYIQTWNSTSASESSALENLKIKVGDVLDSISLTDLYNYRVAVPNKQYRIVVLDFWYRGCYPCLQALPKIDTLYQKYKDKGIIFYGVNGYDADQEKLKKFIETRGFMYQTLLDSGNTLGKKYNIRAYPFMLILDAQTNEILDFIEGFSPDMVEKISAKLDSYLYRLEMPRSK